MTPLFCLHGFTLSGAQFVPLSGYLERPIAAPDLPGHAGSPIPATLEGVLKALSAMAETLGAPLPVLGYSMGGRIALTLALERPDLVDRLVLVSASPGLRDRTARAAEDEALAARIEEIGVSAFLDDWLTRPLTSTAAVDEEARRLDRAVREDNTARGLAAALRGLGQGSLPYVGDRLGGLEMPMLAVAGGADERYAAIAHEMAEAVPDGQARVLYGIGHNVVLEAPEQLAAMVEAFLSSPRSP